MTETLYELTSSLQTLKEMALDMDIDEETLRDTMEAVEGAFEDKADGYAKVMTELNGQVAMLKSEITRLTDRKKAIENNIDRIKKALEQSMVVTGKTKFKTDLFSFNIAKNPAALKLAENLDMAIVPAEYLVFPEPVVDKAKVKDAIKNGQEFAWATLEQGESLRIK